MVRGFEELTAPITDGERDMAEALKEAIERRPRGKRGAWTATQMAEYLGLKKSTSGPTVRKIVHYLRVTGRVPLLLAGSYGYYRAESPEEAEDYVIGVRQRIGGMQEIVSAIKRQARRTEAVQLDLYTEAP